MLSLVKWLVCGVQSAAGQVPAGARAQRALGGAAAGGPQGQRRGAAAGAGAAPARRAAAQAATQVPRAHAHHAHLRVRRYCTLTKPYFTVDWSSGAIPEFVGSIPIQD